MPKSLNLVSANCGKVTPGNVEEYVRAGGYESLKKALSMRPCAVVDEIVASGLRGRGRNISYATPTRANPEPSRTSCFLKRTRCA